MSTSPSGRTHSNLVLPAGATHEKLTSFARKLSNFSSHFCQGDDTAPGQQKCAHQNFTDCLDFVAQMFARRKQITFKCTSGGPLQLLCFVQFSLWGFFFCGSPCSARVLRPLCAFPFCRPWSLQFRVADQLSENYCCYLQVPVSLVFNLSSCLLPPGAARCSTGRWSSCPTRASSSASTTRRGACCCAPCTASSTAPRPDSSTRSSSSTTSQTCVSTVRLNTSNGTSSQQAYSTVQTECSPLIRLRTRHRTD